MLRVTRSLARAPGSPMTTAEATPTVVLVHGAFADASSWLPVITELHAAGISAVAPANPLRSLSGDSDAYLASFVGQIDGPVLLVGHSYGGAVITNAAAAGGQRRRAGLRRRVHPGRRRVDPRDQRRLSRSAAQRGTGRSRRTRWTAARSRVSSCRSRPSPIRTCSRPTCPRR